MANDIPSTPKSSKLDAAHAAAKAGLSMVPVLGGPAVELFQFLIQPPLEKRRGEWMEAVATKLMQMEHKGLNLESLQTNEQFTTAVMQATQSALRTHVASKRDALRNAVLNVAVGQAPNETVQHLLLGFIEDLTEMHLRILQAAHAPSAPPGLTMGGLSDVLEHCIPELRSHKDIYEQLWRDLYLRGLLNTERLNVTMSGHGLTQQRTTGLGVALLKFIAEPQ
jgi:hypothetical protein